MARLDHQHLLVKAWVTNPPTEVEALQTWLAELVVAIKMKIVIPPRAVYVEAIGNKGLTGSVNIETSHCAIHVWDEPVPAMIQMDVYSCSCFDPETVINKLREFGLVNYEQMVIDRNDNFVVTNHSKHSA